MRNMKFLPALIGAALFVAIIVYVAFYFIFLDLFVDLWWFQSLKQEPYFWLRLLYRFFLSGGVTLFFFLIFFFHFWIASRYLGLNPPDEILNDLDKRRRFQRFADVFMSGSVRVYTPISLVLAIFIAIPFYNQWETALLFFFGQDSGVSDVVYGNDVKFYMLSYPIFMLIQQELLSTAIIIFLAVGALYWLEHVFIPNQNKEYHIGAKIHLMVLIAFIVGFVIWGFMLERFSLLYNETHEPVFFGPGFVEIYYKLPLIWLEMITFLAVAVTACLFIFSKEHRSKTPFLISSGAFLLAAYMPSIESIPDIIQKYIVNPNPVKAEKPFMQHNIDATLNAYDLNHVNIVDQDINLNAAEDIATWSTQKRFENIPVWDREFLIESYQQLQVIRPYYTFMAVDEDRYFLLGHTRQVNLAAREIDISKLPEAARNWENTHFRYTHGTGAVMTPAAQDADIPLVWYLRDLNLYSTVGLSTENPEIYYGQGRHDYVIVPNNLKVVGLEETDKTIEKQYTGKGGIPIPSLFRKALMAFYLKDPKIFFSLSIDPKNSKIMIRRNITERVKTITPYLQMDNDPYLVMGKDRFYWIQDAYTISKWYPASKPAADEYLNGDEPFNYIRNSVKIIVDAFDGTVDYYVADPSDVIIKAYARAYPSLFKSMDEMPLELKKHLRYPRELFYMQMKVYAKFHQTAPELFYQEAETWQFAKVRNKEIRPYYQTMDFGNCKDREEFVMINPMTPINRDNLSMIGVAGILDKEKCNYDYKPGITIYKFRKEVQVNGPAQVESLINQSPEISSSFTLWDQKGSEVKLGRMVILPMGKTVLYVQPLYLVSESVKIPELRRVIVSIGNQVVMDKTLWSAFNRLKQMFIKNADLVGGTGTSKESESNTE